MIYELGFNRNYYTVTLILLIMIVLCGFFSFTKFIIFECFDLKWPAQKARATFCPDVQELGV